MNKNSMMIIAVVLIVLAGVGGFVGGMFYTRVHQGLGFAGALNGNDNGNGSRRFGPGAMMGGNGQNQNFRGGRGQVVSLGNGTMTIKLPDGSTRLIVVSDSTNYLKTDKVTQSDIKTGDTVTIVGTHNSDGSITAQDVLVGTFPGQPQPQPTSNAGTGY